MAEFYTVIALVLSVSGATYGAIYALHHFCNERVEKWQESIRLGNEACQESGTSITRSRGKSYNTLFYCTKFVWGWSFGIPVLLFCAYSFFSSYVACHEYTDRTAESPNALLMVEGDLDIQFAWLRVVLWVNASCIIAAITALGLMKIFVGSMQGWKTQAEQIEARDTTPERSTPGTPTTPTVDGSPKDAQPDEKPSPESA